MTFPAPKDYNETKSKSTETKTETETDDEMSFPDDMNRHELKTAIRKYQEWCNENYDALDVDLDGFPTEISDKMKRTAGKVAHKKRTGIVSYVRYAFKAYKEWGWEKFAETIRHELIHVHTIQNHQVGGHGYHFKQMVEPLDTHRHCEKFSQDEVKYLLYCTGCDEQIGERFKRSKTVSQPEKYSSKCCGESLRVEDVR